jgi:hypothetical protein
LAAALGCAEGFAPGQPVNLAIVPVLSGAMPGVLSGDLDVLRIRIARVPSGALVIDTTVAVDAAGNVDLPLTVPLLSDPEQFEVLLEGIRSADVAVLYSGVDTVSVSAAAATPPPVEIAVRYVGPCQATSGCTVTVSPVGASLSSGDSLLMTIVVDSSGIRVTGVPVSLINLDTALLQVRSTRYIVARSAVTGGQARVVAQIRSDEDTLVVVVLPPGGPGPATQLAFLAQPTNVGSGATIVPPVEVAVKDAFGRIVTAWAMPVTIRFAKNVGGAILGGTTSRDPVNGVATFDDLTVDQPGTGYTLIATSDALTTPESAPFNVTPPAAVVFAGDSTDGVVLNSGVFRVNPDGSARFRLSDRGRAGDVHPRWSPDRRRVGFSFDPGTGRNELFMTALTGDTVASLVSDTSVRRARWSPDGVHLAFECGAGFTTQEDVCVIPDVTGPITGLSRVGDGAGRVVVTDFDPSKVDGPASFAWDPTDSKRLIVVRDSLTAFGLASRLWTVGFDGQTPLPLSPAMLDVGKGPLTIAGPLDVTSDGATIVFAATDSTFSRKLYLIQRDGSGLRPLTGGTAFDDRPVFSPDGRQVLFIRDSGCSVDYWRVDAQTGMETQVSAEGWCDFNSAVLGHDWSPDGKDIVLVGGEPPGGFADTRIYHVSAATTAATYLQDRRLIGRAADPGAFVRDIQPSWRP